VVVDARWGHCSLQNDSMCVCVCVCVALGVLGLGKVDSSSGESGIASLGAALLFSLREPAGILLTCCR